MKVCRYTGYSEITQAAKNAELFSSRNGLTNLGQRSSLLGQFKLRHLWPLLRQTKLIGRAAWSHVRRNHGRFAELQSAEATRYRRPIRIFLAESAHAGIPATQPSCADSRASGIFESRPSSSSFLV
jgi:hypothetical protein